MEIVSGFAISGPVGTVTGAASMIASWVADPFVSPQQLLKTIRPADLIEFKRVGYMHWAMYSDIPGYVYNIPAESKNDKYVTITLEKLKDVASDSMVRVNNHQDVARKLGFTRRSVKEALAAAKADLNKTLKYDFKTVNCEYYCTKWLYGTGFSTQSDNAIAGIVATGAAAHSNGIVGAYLCAGLGGPLGAVVGYTISTAIVGVIVSVVFETAGKTHYTRK